ncbi:hypothetical protein FQR65_LT14230 [Abscondita terminalis]|nr:hypothetical protein FQR65_LT14230 [Abscondita terminalis]
MVSFCCVINCGSRAKRDDVKFFRIPAELHFKHKTEHNELSRRRREKWLEAIRREDLTETKLKYSVVCSKHFVTGKPASLIDSLNRDWIPTLNMGYIIGTRSLAAKTHWRNRKQLKVEEKTENAECRFPNNDSVLPPKASPSEIDSDVIVKCKVEMDDTNQSDGPNEENYFEKIKEEFVEVFIKSEPYVDDFTSSTIDCVKGLRKDCIKTESLPYFINIKEELDEFSGEKTICKNEPTSSDTVHYRYRCNDAYSSEPCFINVKKEFDELAGEEIVKEEYGLLNANQSVHPDEPTRLYYCYDCNHSSNDKKNITNHILTHRFNCKLCGYVTFDISSFRVHMHTKQNSFKCEFCDYSCKNRSYLKKHAYKHSDDWPYKCDECDYKGCDKTALTWHKRIHTKEKPFKCEFCDYSCAQPGHLKNHLYKHSGEWPYKCDKCDYKCSQKTTFANHKSTHIKEKPFKCNLCDYSSAQPVKLKSHLYKHSVSTFFVCDKCDYKGYDKLALIWHKKTHTKEQRLKCQFCDYSCVQSVSLKNHMFKHSGGWPYECDKCDYKCSKQFFFNRHYKTHTK